MNLQHHFQVNSTHKSFNDKQRDLFNELDKVNVVLPQRRILESEDDKKDTHNRFHMQSLKSLRGKESIFKRPEIPIRKCLPTRVIPDFQRNPHKWTKYTLDDVKDEDISEKGNTMAALSFLKEIEDRNSTTNEIKVLPNKVTFKKSALVVGISADSDSQQMFKNSKVLMPEYVVGQKIKKQKKNKEKRFGQISKQLSLSHLMAEDDEN